jgi:putative SOS response-associated peptidase YedK
MISRLTLALPIEQVRRVLRCHNLPGWPCRYNIAPPQPLPIVRRDANGGRRLSQMQWGLIPEWARDEALGRTHINAPAAALEKTPALLVPLRERRCLVAADGWYVWERGTGGRRRSWRFTRADGLPFLVAAMWSSWRTPENRMLDSVAFVTVPANATVAPLAPVMPALLGEEEQEAWLDPDADVVDLLALLVPCWSEDIAGYRVGPLVDDPRNESPDCIAAVA